MNTYKEIAEKQNMAIARVKAIEILELLEDKTSLTGKKWYDYEDRIMEIIESN